MCLGGCGCYHRPRFDKGRIPTLWGEQGVCEGGREGGREGGSSGREGGGGREGGREGNVALSGVMVPPLV